MTDAITKLWTRTKADEHAVSQGCYFDLAAAEKVRAFFRKFLRHSKGQFAGKPFELLEWQWKDIVAPLFGWKRKDGTRRYRKAYIEIPKKQGKSTMAAGVGLYMLTGDGERGAEVYSAASSRDQASIVHGEAINMVDASEGLSSYLHVNRSTKEILFDRYNSKYKALASEAGTAEGLNAHGLIIDELHAWTGEHGRKFFESLKYAGRSRQQPLQFIITTAGDDELSVCWELHQYAKQVLSGEVVDPRFFAYIAAAEPGDDWTKPEIWRKANPSMGETMSEDEFAADLQEAVKTPTSLAQFLRYSFNLWAQTGGVPAITPEDWQANFEAFTEDDLANSECWAGLDLARSKDMTALSLVFRNDDGDSYKVLTYFWLPQASVDAKGAPEHFRVWARQGLLRATEGNVTDYRQVEKDIVEEIFPKFSVQSLAFDPYFAEELTQRIADASGVERVEFRQTVSNYAAPCAEIERLVLSQRFRHNGCPVMAWQIRNLRWKTDSRNNRMPDKSDQGVKKIDGAVAAIMGLGRALLSPVEQRGGLSWL